MSLFARPASRLVAPLILLLLLPAAVGAQRRAVPRHPAHPQPALAVRGHVFIGGYFYDPFFGPYPWWPRAAHPYWYAPVYDRHAEVRLRVEPKAARDAAVYVDGFYAGTVHDFNGVFEALPLPPGGHRIVLFLEGYRTARHNIYLRPGSMFSLREVMEPVPAGETSEAPDVVPPVPPPPPGSYRAPVTPPRVTAPAATPAPAAVAGFGTVDLYVQPANADVTIDGQRWVSADDGHFVVQVPVGKHHIEVKRDGYRQFAIDVDLGEGQTYPLNVSLLAATH